MISHSQQFELHKPCTEKLFGYGQENHGTAVIKTPTLNHVKTRNFSDTDLR